jgi:hypothetical protein
LNRFIGLEPERIRSAVNWFERSQLPVLQSIGGFRTVFLGHDLASGTAAGMTFWESESALQLTESREGATRDRAVERAGGSLAEGMVDRYRILFEHRGASFGEPTHARLAHWNGVRPSLISDAMSQFELEQVPILERTDGFCGLVAGANFLLGNTVSVSFWSSAAALHQSLAWEIDARGAIESGAGLTPRGVFADSYTVAIAPELRQLDPWPAWDNPQVVRVDPELVGADSEVVRVDPRFLRVAA